MFLKKIKDKKKKKYILIMSSDFETVILDNIHYVYAIGLMYKSEINKIIYKDFFINTSKKNCLKKESNILLKEYIEYILRLSNSKNKIFIYFHNLRNFDGFFIVNIINEHFNNIDKYKKKILIKDNSIFYIKLNNIIFLDSLNILNNKLSDIAKKFLKEDKIDFDISKVDSIEKIIYYYNSIKKYLYKDVELLFKIINITRNRFLDLYNLDITTHFTISNIAMSIFRKNFFDDKKIEIEITKANKYKYIKKSYYGGLCNVHKTYLNGEGFLYDVNSLYPYVMKTCEMPIGKGEFIIKNLENKKDINEYFGFIHCMIYVPKHLKIPPLMLRYEGTIMQAIGYLKGIWFSEEIKYAIQLGCRIIKVYSILNYKKKAIIFDKFVEDLYEKKKNSKNNIDRYLYKTIMNSLYGRFGMRENMNISIWDNEENEYLEHITKFEEIFDGNIRICKLSKELYENVKKIDSLSKEDKNNIDKLFHSLKTKQENTILCIHIASAITSYSRLKLLKDIYDHINNNKAIIYYYDTDSIITNIRLNKNMISDEIGQYKLEHEFIEGVFLAPKVYSLKLNNDKFLTKFKSLKKNYNNVLFDELKDILLEKNKKMFFYNIEIPIIKNIVKGILCSTKKNMIFSFISKKYDKYYKDNFFESTKPKYINKWYWFIEKVKKFLKI